MEAFEPPKHHLNVTFFGDEHSGKSSLLKALAGVAQEEELRRQFTPLVHFPTSLCLNLFEATNTLKKITRTAERLFTTDLFVYCVSFVDKEDEFTAANFPKTNEPDIKSKVRLYNSAFQVLQQYIQFNDLLPNLVIAFTKCEAEVAETLNEKLNHLKNKWIWYLTSQGLPQKGVTFVATSAFQNANVVQRGNTFDSEECLMDILMAKAATIREARQMSMADRFRLSRFSVMRPYKKLGSGTVAEGFGLGADLKVGEEVLILPANKKTKIGEIQFHNQQVKQTVRGGAFGINLKGVDLCDVPRGSIVCKIDHLDPAFANTRTITAHLFFVYAFNFINRGFVMSLVGHNLRVPVVIEEISEILDFETVTNEWEFGHAVIGTLLVAKLQLLQPALLERVDEFPELGRFALVGSNIIYAYGHVQSINPSAA